MRSADELRSFVLELPDVEERETWGHPIFRIRGKMFLTLADDGTSATVKASRDEQASLLEADPDTFTFPAYVGRHGWVQVRLARADDAQLRELVVEAWRQTAPKRVVADFDARRPDQGLPRRCTGPVR